MRDVIFLAHRAPFPPDRGDKIRAYHVLRHLTARARVHLVAFADDARDMDEGACDLPLAGLHLHWRGKSRLRAAAEAMATGQAVSEAAFADAGYARSVHQLLSAHPDAAVYVYSSQMAQYVPKAAHRRFVMDFCDVDSAKFDEYAAHASGPMRWMWHREARLLRAHDLAVAARADASLFVSEAEAGLFRSLGGRGDVRVMENGIDTDFFDPARVTADPADGRLIVFTGQMDYPPNVAAVRWFADEVLPLIRAAHPDVRFAIVGRAPTAEVLALASETVIVTGEVADVRGWLKAAACVVAPLRIARGIQNKVLEAMAMARPVVVSRAAAEGVDHADTLRAATDAQEYAAEVDAVLADPASAEAMGEAARARMLARYGWAVRLAPLEGLLGLDGADAQAAA